jgi:hypothetical protein
MSFTRVFSTCFVDVLQFLFCFSQKTQPPYFPEERGGRVTLWSLQLSQWPQIDPYFQTLKCLYFHQDCYEGGKAKKPIVCQSVGIPSPHEPTNLTTPFIGREKNSQNIYKPRDQEWIYLLIVY